MAFFSQDYFKQKFYKSKWFGQEFFTGNTFFSGFALGWIAGTPAVASATTIDLVIYAEYAGIKTDALFTVTVDGVENVVVSVTAVAKLVTITVTDAIAQDSLVKVSYPSEDTNNLGIFEEVIVDTSVIPVLATRTFNTPLAEMGMKELRVYANAHDIDISGVHGKPATIALIESVRG